MFISQQTLYEILRLDYRPKTIHACHVLCIEIGRSLSPFNIKHGGIITVAICGLDLVKRWTIIDRSKIYCLTVHTHSNVSLIDYTKLQLTENKLPTRLY